jgi:hypothetical protein|tara:strand:- start:7211 stop:7945 length:735 start_codon:yes stop_codon:yes gene_type:complete
MKVFLAGSGWEKRLWMKDNFYKFYRLHTFYHIAEHEAKVINKYDDFLLDSGAFSFFGGKVVNWDEYLTDYINFINKYDVKLFFELDLYRLIGIKETEKLRARLEKETNKQSIPVFHKMLGIDYYKMLCKNYNYIAIGASGMYDTDWTRKDPKKLLKMLLFAKKLNTKVHGLGYTKIPMLDKMPFYSVDSTSWLAGSRFGVLHFFNGRDLRKVKKPLGTRLKTFKTAESNFYEWVKFTSYAKDNL